MTPTEQDKRIGGEMNDIIKTRLNEVTSDIRKINDYLSLKLNYKSRVSLNILKDILVDAQADLKEVLNSQKQDNIVIRSNS